MPKTKHKMTLDELVSHSAEGKDLPKKKGGSKKKKSNPKSEFLKFIKGRKDKTGKAKG